MKKKCYKLLIVFTVPDLQIKMSNLSQNVGVGQFDLLTVTFQGQIFFDLFIKRQNWRCDRSPLYNFSSRKFYYDTTLPQWLDRW